MERKSPTNSMQVYTNRTDKELFQVAAALQTYMEKAKGKKLTSTCANKPEMSKKINKMAKRLRKTCLVCGKGEEIDLDNVGVRTLQKCSRCKRAFYCSVECQRKDWPTHKPACNIVALQKALQAEK